MAASTNSSPILPNFTFYSRSEYFHDLAQRAELLGKGDSMTVMAMAFEPDVASIGKLATSLCEAAKRQANIRLIIDAYTFMNIGHGLPGPLFYNAKLSANMASPYGDIFQKLEELQRSGGNYWIINKPARPFINPYSGRSHIKLALINDRVYIGGCNLDDENYADLMVAWQDAATSQWLYRMTEEITNRGSVSQALNGTDRTRVINASMTIYVDSGVKQQSLIYKQALSLIDAADKELLVTCQYFPGGPTAQHLLSAQKRGISPIILFSGPSAHGRQAPLQYMYNFRERRQLPASFFAGEQPADRPKLHAKLIATEHGAMIGSHNYINVGVKLGTAEIALRVDDPAFAKAAAAKIKSLL